MNFCLVLLRWFMPVNIGITFLIGTILGWLVIRIVRPEHHLEGLVIASCSAGNFNFIRICISAKFSSDWGRMILTLPACIHAKCSQYFCQLSIIFCRIRSGLPNTMSHHFNLNSDICNFPNQFKVFDKVLHI